MRKLIVTGIATASAVLLAPTAALAQLSFDPTAEPPRETGGWVFNAAQLMVFLGIVLVILVWAGYMRWSPYWAAKREQKAAPTGGAAPTLAPPVPKPEKPEPLPPEAAAASVESVGETLPAPAEEPSGDVYHDTLEELLSKGVPQKVAEARARAAAKKAQG